MSDDDSKPKRRPGNPNWTKGVSGNPKGSTKGRIAMSKSVAAYIADRTLNGQLLVDRLLELGLTMPAPDAATKRIAIAAVLALFDRGAGRAQQEVSVTVTSGPSTAKLRELSEEQLELLARVSEVDDGEEDMGALPEPRSSEVDAISDAIDDPEDVLEVEGHFLDSDE